MIDIITIGMNSTFSTYELQSTNATIIIISVLIFNTDYFDKIVSTRLELFIVIFDSSNLSF